MRRLDVEVCTCRPREVERNDLTVHFKLGVRASEKEQRVQSPGALFHEAAHSPQRDVRSLLGWIRLALEVVQWQEGGCVPDFAAQCKSAAVARMQRRRGRGRVLLLVFWADSVDDSACCNAATTGGVTCLAGTHDAEEGHLALKRDTTAPKYVACQPTAAAHGLIIADDERVDSEDPRR